MALGLYLALCLATPRRLPLLQDLHIDRTDGNRQRQMNYDYAQSKLCQPSAMPGFMHHNSDRGCSSDRTVEVWMTYSRVTHWTGLIYVERQSVATRPT